ncbi:MAG: BamA/TamA family outer membrane protein [Bacteroidales bacterium]|nr:BamA/TamA family outer membrane protein [Bacteroidales bacterium]
MTKTLKFLLLIISLFQIQNLTASTDSTSVAENGDEIIKRGWNFGVLPAISYDNDLGFQYGGLINLYNYGNGSRYPVYDHSFYLEISAYTRGSGIYRFAYNSDRLIPKIEVFLDISYIPNQAYNFFGWNGYEAVYNQQWEDNNQPEDIYRSGVFYRYENKMFRFKTDFQGEIHKGFSWLAGMQWYDYAVGSVDIDKLNKGRDEDERLPSLTEQPGLFDMYKEWGLIQADEANGGSITLLKAGLLFDTRDNKPNPMTGIWSELAVEAAPALLGTFNSGYAKLSLIHRQYFTLIPDDLSFAARLAVQANLAGDAPFWIQPLMITTMLRGATEEGLGGVRNLRGIPRNRIVGAGVAYGNAELRWKFFRTRLFSQNFYFGLNSFCDAGQVIQKIDIGEKVKALNLPDQADYFSFGSEQLHITYGLGLRVAMNQNFILAVDWGKSADERDGTSGFYVGLNYLF